LGLRAKTESEGPACTKDASKVDGVAEGCGPPFLRDGNPTGFL